MYVCRKHLEYAVDSEIVSSNIGQAKIRALHKRAEVHHCEICDKGAYYQVVPIEFS